MVVDSTGNIPKVDKLDEEKLFDELVIAQVRNSLIRH